MDKEENDRVPTIDGPGDSPPPKEVPETPDKETGSPSSDDKEIEIEGLGKFPDEKTALTALTKSLKDTKKSYGEMSDNYQNLMKITLDGKDKKKEETTEEKKEDEPINWEETALDSKAFAEKIIERARETLPSKEVEELKQVVGNIQRFQDGRDLTEARKLPGFKENEKEIKEFSMRFPASVASEHLAELYPEKFSGLSNPYIASFEWWKLISGKAIQDALDGQTEEEKREAEMGTEAKTLTPSTTAPGKISSSKTDKVITAIESSEKLRGMLKASGLDKRKFAERLIKEGKVKI